MSLCSPQWNQRIIYLISVGRIRKWGAYAAAGLSSLRIRLDHHANRALTEHQIKITTKAIHNAHKVINNSGLKGVPIEPTPIDLLLSQYLPSYSLGQLHTKFLSSSDTQIPPFKHGVALSSHAFFFL